MSGAKTLPPVAAQLSAVWIWAIAAGFATGSTYYDAVLLDPIGGAATGIYDGVAVGTDHLGWPTIWSDNGTTTTLLPLQSNFRPAAGDRYAIWANQIGGSVANHDNGAHDAVLWNGTSALPVDLGDNSQVNAIYDGIQAGTGRVDNAVIWRGTAAGVFSLVHPGSPSEAYGIWGNDVCGTTHSPLSSDPNAALWTDATGLPHFVGLSDTPSMVFTQSAALGTSRGQEAGWAIIPNAGKHAGIWSGTAASFQDLGPAGTTASELFATNGTQQVGDVSVQAGTGGQLSPDHHAPVWNGTAGSDQILPGPPGSNPLDFASMAYAIDGKGDIAGVWNELPILWIPHRLPGDVNFDGVVNFSDLLILAQNYGHPGEWVDGEFSGDGTVDFADLLTLAQNYGKTQAAVGYSVVAVPEPSAILAACVLGLIPRRRR